MKVCQLRLSNFQSFGPGPTTIELEDLTYVLGPNGAGKTAVLEALSRLFSPLLAQRKIRVEDFHRHAGPRGQGERYVGRISLSVAVRCEHVMAQSETREDRDRRPD